ncbi:hypothetical protein QOZ80_6AG0525130 [Eleusine coracana subsp. coracana]|nr:hypothetical protein QOZ80_6AG0525130 [Eleusine coracana subsp. coracana]
MEIDNEDIADEVDNADDLCELERLHLGIDDNHTPANPDVDIDMGTSDDEDYDPAIPNDNDYFYMNMSWVVLAPGDYDRHVNGILGLLDFYRYKTGYKDRAKIMAHCACPKLVRDMFYEARIQVAIVYHVQHLKVKVTKCQARNTKLTRDEYMQVHAWWCASNVPDWEAVVDKWCAEDWEETYNAFRGRHLLMTGPAQHQGNLSLKQYAEIWSASHDGRPCTQFEAFAMACQGKATTLDVQYNPEAPPMAEVVMRVGEDRKHGRYWIGEGTLDTMTTPTLSMIRVRSTSSSPAIRPRLNTTQSQVDTLQAQLDAERMAREDLEQKMQLKIQQELNRRLEHQ